MIGLNSFTGYRFLSSCGSEYHVGGSCRKPLDLPGGVECVVADLEPPQSLFSAIKNFEPDFVINTVAIGNVDYCEQNRAEALAVNYEFPLSLAGFLRDEIPACRLVHMFTNAVYDGDHAPYREDAKLAPLNHYGVTKARADEALLREFPDALIARPITMYGISEDFQRANPLDFILKSLRQGKAIRLVDDVYGNLLFLDDLIAAMLGLMRAGASGVYNVAGAERLNRYEFGLKVAEGFGLDAKLISPCDSSAFPSLARRPADTTMDLSKISNETGFRPRPIREVMQTLAGVAN